MLDKNLDWLKNKVDSLETEVSEYMPHNDMIDRDEVLDLIDQLDEPEINEEQVLEYAKNNDLVVFNKTHFDLAVQKIVGNAVCAVSEKAISTLSKMETVELPRFVADWIDGIKSGEVHAVATGEEDLIFEICQQYYEETLTEQLRKWFESNINSYVFYNAVLHGYTIEPPKTLQVIIKNYDSTVFTTELPEDEARKLIEGWKGNE